MLKRRAAWIVIGALLSWGCSSPSQRAPEGGAPPDAASPAGKDEAARPPTAQAVAGRAYAVLLSTQTPTRKDPIIASLCDAITHAQCQAAAFRWYVNGEPVPVRDPALPVSRFRRGDEVFAEAVAAPGGGPPIASQRVRVGNAPPVVASVTIEPAAPRKGETLKAAAVASDADDDPVQVVYRWKVNGKLVQEGKGDGYSLAGARKGDQVHCEAVPDDGLAPGVWAASPVLEVGNSPPRIVSVPPAQAAPGSPYTYSLRAEDPDGDPIRTEIVSGPPGLALEGGTLRWAPPAGASGPHRVVVRITDAAGGEARQEFTLTVSK